MKRGIILAAALASWCGAANFAAAQFGVLGQAPIRSHPAVSPYINMGIGTGGGLGYYGIVRPQTAGNQAIYNLQQNVNQLNPDGSLRGQLTGNSAVAAVSGLQTGHPATFFNTGGYYPIRSPGGSNVVTNAGYGGMAGNPGMGLGGYNPGFGGINGGFGAVRPFFAGTLNAVPR